MLAPMKLVARGDVTVGDLVLYSRTVSDNAEISFLYIRIAYA